MTPTILKLSNLRLKRALSIARIVRNAGTITEVRDALNHRRNARLRHLTRAERDELDRKAQYGI